MPTHQLPSREGAAPHSLFLPGVNFPVEIKGEKNKFDPDLSSTQLRRIEESASLPLSILKHAPLKVQDHRRRLGELREKVSKVGEQGQSQRHRAGPSVAFDAGGESEKPVEMWDLWHQEICVAY